MVGIRLRPRASIEKDRTDAADIFNDRLLAQVTQPRHGVAFVLYLLLSERLLRFGS